MSGVTWLIGFTAGQTALFAYEMNLQRNYSKLYDVIIFCFENLCSKRICKNFFVQWRNVLRL